MTHTFRIKISGPKLTVEEAKEMLAKMGMDCETEGKYHAPPCLGGVAVYVETEWVASQN